MDYESMTHQQLYDLLMSADPAEAHNAAVHFAASSDVYHMLNDEVGHATTVVQESWEGDAADAMAAATARTVSDGERFATQLRRVAEAHQEYARNVLWAQRLMPKPASGLALTALDPGQARIQHQQAVQIMEELDLRNQAPISTIRSVTAAMNGTGGDSGEVITPYTSPGAFPDLAPGSGSGIHLEPGAILPTESPQSVGFGGGNDGIIGGVAVHTPRQETSRTTG